MTEPNSKTPSKVKMGRTNSSVVDMYRNNVNRLYIQCVHCDQIPKLGIKRDGGLQNTEYFCSHIEECAKCPKNIKGVLRELQKVDKTSGSEMFYSEVWNRIRSYLVTRANLDAKNIQTGGGTESDFEPGKYMLVKPLDSQYASQYLISLYMNFRPCSHIPQEGDRVEFTRILPSQRIRATPDVRRSASDTPPQRVTAIPNARSLTYSTPYEVRWVDGMCPWKGRYFLSCVHCHEIPSFGIKIACPQNSSKDFLSHLRNCKKCPPYIKERLCKLYNLKEKSNSPRFFYKQVLNRIMCVVSTPQNYNEEEFSHQGGADEDFENSEFLLVKPIDKMVASRFLIALYKNFLPIVKKDNSDQRTFARAHEEETCQQQNDSEAGDSNQVVHVSAPPLASGITALQYGQIDDRTNPLSAEKRTTEETLGSGIPTLKHAQIDGQANPLSMGRTTTEVTPASGIITLQQLIDERTKQLFTERTKVESCRLTLHQLIDERKKQLCTERPTGEETPASDTSKPRRMPYHVGCIRVDESDIDPKTGFSQTPGAIRARKRRKQQRKEREAQKMLDRSRDVHVVPSVEILRASDLHAFQLNQEHGTEKPPASVSRDVQGTASTLSDTNLSRTFISTPAEEATNHNIISSIPSTMTSFGRTYTV